MKLLKLAASLASAFAAAGLGSLATIPNVDTWYKTIEQPTFSPPDWVFGPVWTVLYVLIGVSLYLAWTAPQTGPKIHLKTRQYIAYAVQLILNAAWSIVFFGIHQIDLGLAVIIALLLSVAVTIRLFAKVSRPAAYILVPYLLWVSFATCLNLGIALLN